jgi:hypothetical protein
MQSKIYLDRHKTLVDEETLDTGMSPDKYYLKEIFDETCENFLLPIVKSLDK